MINTQFSLRQPGYARYGIGHSEPRFGRLDEIGQVLVNALLNNQSAQKEEVKKQKQKNDHGWKKWINAIAWNSVGLTFFTALFSNLDTFFKIERQFTNRMQAIQTGQTLEKVAEAYNKKHGLTPRPKEGQPLGFLPGFREMLPFPRPVTPEKAEMQAPTQPQEKADSKTPKAESTKPQPKADPKSTTQPNTPPATGSTTETKPGEPQPKQLTPEEWIGWLRHPRIILSTSDLEEISKIGFVKEVYTADKNIQNALGLTQWDVVLVDGTEVYADVSTTYREKALKELNVPILRAKNGYNMDIVKAGLLATMIMGIMNGLRTMLKREHDNPTILTDDEKQRVMSNDLGRTVVAMELGVTKDRLEIESLKKIIYGGSPSMDEIPMTEKEMRHRMVVNMAGRAAEEILHDNNPSVASLGAIRENSAIAYEMVMNLALGETFKHHSPNLLNLNDAQKEKAEAEISKLLKEANDKAREILGKYGKERLLEARKGMMTLKEFSEEELKAVLSGKTLEEIKQERRNKRRWFFKPKAPKAPEN